MIEKEDMPYMENGTIASMTIGYGTKRNPYNPRVPGGLTYDQEII